MNFPDIGGGRGAGGVDSSLFVRLKAGDKINGVFRGDPKIFRLHWIGGRSHRCQGKDLCEHCAGGDKPKFRFMLNFITKVDNVWLAKIYEGGYQTYKALKELHESDYNLEETAVSIKREGEGTDTRYIVMPLKNNGGLKAADFKAVGAIPLNPFGDDEKAADTPAEETDSNEDVPF